MIFTLIAEDRKWVKMKVQSVDGVIIFPGVVLQGTGQETLIRNLIDEA